MSNSDDGPEASGRFLVAKENGVVSIFDSDYPADSDRSHCYSWQAHNNAVFDIKWLERDTKVLTSSGDHSIHCFDFPSEYCSQQFIGHQGTVKTIACRQNDPHIFATGARDGSVKLWDSRSCKRYSQRYHEGSASVFEIASCHVPDNYVVSGEELRSRRRSKLGDTVISVTSVLFQDDTQLITSGSSDGKIKFWDLRKFKTKTSLTPYHVIPYAGVCGKKNGISDMILDSGGNRLFVYCLDSVVYEYNITNESIRPTNLYSSGHSASSFYIKARLSPDDRYLGVGSENGMAYLYPITERGKQSRDDLLILPGHDSEVTTAVFNPLEPMMLVSISDDCRIRVWRNRPDRQKLEPSGIYAMAINQTPDQLEETRSPQLRRMQGSLHSPPDGKPWRCPSAVQREAAMRRKQINMERFLMRSPFAPVGSQSAQLAGRDRPFYLTFKCGDYSRTVTIPPATTTSLISPLSPVHIDLADLQPDLSEHPTEEVEPSGSSSMMFNQPTMADTTLTPNGALGRSGSCVTFRRRLSARRRCSVLLGSGTALNSGSEFCTSVTLPNATSSDAVAASHLEIIAEGKENDPTALTNSQAEGADGDRNTDKNDLEPKLKRCRTINTGTPPSSVLTRRQMKRADSMLHSPNLLNYFSSRQ